MTIKNLIVVSSEDTASCNIKRALLELGDWHEAEAFEGAATYTMGDTVIATIPQMHLYYNNIDKSIESALGDKPENVIFASRHRSQSGLKTLTVHPIGNFTEAKFGGEIGKLVPSAPRAMTTALRILRKEGASLQHQISFETTHHGPYLSTPSFYIEIGSDADAWEEEEPGNVIATTILKTLAEAEAVDDKIAVGVGGGHYAPRFTDIIQSHKIAVGHMISNYSVDLPWEIFRSAIEATPGVECVYFHRKSLKKPRYREMREWFEAETELDIVASKSLEPRES